MDEIMLLLSQPVKGFIIKKGGQVQEPEE